MIPLGVGVGVGVGLDGIIGHYSVVGVSSVISGQVLIPFPKIESDSEAEQSQFPKLKVAPV